MKRRSLERVTQVEESACAATIWQRSKTLPNNLSAYLRSTGSEIDL